MQNSFTQTPAPGLHQHGNRTYFPKHTASSNATPGDVQAIRTGAEKNTKPRICDLLVANQDRGHDNAHDESTHKELNLWVILLSVWEAPDPCSSRRSTLRSSVLMENARQISGSSEQHEQCLSVTKVSSKLITLKLCTQQR